jgi:hypothetical protein
MNKTLAKRLLELKGFAKYLRILIQRIRIKIQILAYSFKVHYLIRVNGAGSSWRSGLGARLRSVPPGFEHRK